MNRSFIRRSATCITLSLSLLTATARRVTGESVTGLSASQVLHCERTLQGLGYWIESADGKFDDSTLSAIKAFRRINGYSNAGQPNVADLTALEKAKPFVRRAEGFPHFEVDLKRQILLFIDKSGQTDLILTVSTGSGRLFTEGGRARRASTPKGVFAVYRKDYGWHQSPLGKDRKSVV